MTTNHLMLTFLQFWTCDSHDEDVELTEQDPRHTDLQTRPSYLATIGQENFVFPHWL